MRVGFVYLFLLVGLALPIISGLYGYCFYLFANLFRPLQFAFGAVSLPLHGIIAPGILILSIIRDVVFGKTLSFRFLMEMKFMVLFLIWCGVSAAFSSSYIWDPWEYYLTIVKIIVPILLIGMAIADLRELNVVTWCVLLGVGLWAAQGAIWGIAMGNPQITMGIRGGQMSDRNDFVAGVVTIIPLAWYLARNSDRMLYKTMGYGLAFFSVICVFVSNSRGGIVGFVGLFFLFLYRQKQRFKAIFIYGMIGLLGGLLFVPDYVWERLSTIEIQGEQTEASASERMIAMSAGWDCFRENSITGVGPGHWLYYAPNFLGKTLEPHSIWIKCAAETGGIGFALYLAMIGGTLLKLARLKKRTTDPLLKNYAEMYFLAIIGFCLPATFINQTYSELFFVILALASKYYSLAIDQC